MKCWTGYIIFSEKRFEKNRKENDLSTLFWKVADWILIDFFTADVKWYLKKKFYINVLFAPKSRALGIYKPHFANPHALKLPSVLFLPKLVPDSRVMQCRKEREIILPS